MLKRLITLRPIKRHTLRAFSSDKDPESLKEQFKKMRNDIKDKGIDTKTSEEIKIKDQTKMTQELKEKFKGVKDDLSKKTGEAKTAQDRLKESWENFSIPKLSMPDLKK